MRRCSPRAQRSRWTDEVRLVMDRLDGLIEPRRRVHLIGHSYGGLVALRFAQCRSDRIASLALYEPVVFRVLDDDDPALAKVKRLAERISRLVAAGTLDDAVRAFVDFVNPWFEAFIDICAERGARGVTPIDGDGKRHAPACECVE